MAARKKKAAKKKATRKTGEPRAKSRTQSPDTEGVQPREKAKELYLSDPDFSVADVARKLRLPYGRVNRWSNVDGWKEERSGQQARVAEEARERLLEAARQEVGSSFVAMLSQGRELRKRLAERAIEDLEAEIRGEMRDEEEELSSVETNKETGKKIHVRRKRVRVRPNERVVTHLLESDRKWTSILLGILEGKPSPGAQSGTGDAEKVVRKLQAAVAAMDEIEDPGWNESETESEK